MKIAQILEVKNFKQNLDTLVKKLKSDGNTDVCIIVKSEYLDSIQNKFIANEGKAVHVIKMGGQILFIYKEINIVLKGIDYTIDQ